MNKKLVCFITLLATGFSGCDLVGDIIADKVSEKVAEEVTEKAIESALEEEGGGEAEVDLSKGEVNVKTDKGSFSHGSGDAEAKVPDTFPKDISLPENAKVRMAIDGASGMNITLESEDAPDTLVTFAKNDAEKNGWTQKSAADIGTAQLLVYEKNGRTVSITIGRQKQAKSTMLMYNLQKVAK